MSVITCTKRPECMHRLLDNYGRQTFRPKELIVVLNRDSLIIDDYRKAARRYPNVSLYSRPERASLGSCLNFGVRRARYGFIAKFDDDDYYAPGYLADSMRVMAATNADIVGKRAHFMRLGGTNALLHRYPRMANRRVPLVQGATLLAKRRVIRRVAFPNRSRGECVKWCADCAARGFRIYAGSPYNFLAIRRRNSWGHTWIVSDRQLLTRNVKVLRVGNARRFIARG